MAWMNQERKAQRAPEIKRILKKYGIKGSLAVRNHSTLVLNIKSGSIDFINNHFETCSKSPEYIGRYVRKEDYISVNPYWYKEHFTGIAKNFLEEIIPAMYGVDYYDKSDIQADYFDCSHYIDVNIGAWNKPYELTV